MQSGYGNPHHHRYYDYTKTHGSTHMYTDRDRVGSSYRFLYWWPRIGDVAPPLYVYIYFVVNKRVDRNGYGRWIDIAIARPSSNIYIYIYIYIYKKQATHT
jgi:hypothetical protein